MAVRQFVLDAAVPPPACPPGVEIERCDDPASRSGAIADLVAAVSNGAGGGLEAGPVVTPGGILGDCLGRPGRGVTLWLAVVRVDRSRCLGLVTLVERVGEGGKVHHAIGWVLVHPTARREGVGRSLVATAVAEAARRGAAVVSAETRSDWLAATAFWARLGG